MNQINKSHKVILEALKKQPMSALELCLITGQTPSGMRGRITEARHFGYDIQLQEIATKKYVLMPPTATKKILDWTEKLHRFDTIINYSSLSKTLNIPLDDVTNAMIEIYKMGRLIQISPNSAIIRQKTT